MTGTFSIKRRLASSPRPQGQSSQLGVLQALGIGVGRSSPHAGSKRGYVHPSQHPLDPLAAAQAWHKATGRPLPPHLRIRQSLAPPAAMSTRDRAAQYLGAVTSFPALILDTLPTPDLLDSPLFTPAQARRIVHKAGAHGERPAGWHPDRPPQPPRRPRSVAQRRRARKNAAQQARHTARLEAS